MPSNFGRKENTFLHEKRSLKYEFFNCTTHGLIFLFLHLHILTANCRSCKKKIFHSEFFGELFPPKRILYSR